MAKLVAWAREQEPDVCRIPSEDQAIRRWLRKLVKAAAGGEIRMCYEAGPNGFALMRLIEAMAPVIVEVMAPSLTPRRSGQRVKTDPIDAKKLVTLYRAGELRVIATPDEDSEAARDLVRTYHRIAQEMTRKRHHSWDLHPLEAAAFARRTVFGHCEVSAPLGRFGV